ncbi:hypothetical protein QR680_015137 [Steinernema hermaphroditum]|uniref:Uncharacterized protein n=1 Tax=Steinernema hermaphroditum TaxID=289476 RepID=A0AA39M5G0_9BILA|nr:hypothetical protein QR680_015137 [Steinernema hermaphroditum]
MMRFAFVVLLVFLPLVSALSDSDREDFLGRLNPVLDDIAQNGLSNATKEQFNNVIERAKEIGISKALVESQINAKLSEESFSAKFLKAIVANPS